MKTFIAETVQVHSAARKPDSRSHRGCNGRAAALRCALLALLALGLLGGIGQAQEPLVIAPSGDVSIAKTLSVAGNVGIGTKITGWPLTIQGTGVNSDWLQFADSTGKQGYHINFAGGGFNLVETGIKDYRLFIQAGTGNVGIGKTADANAKLDVDGGIIAKTLSVTGNVGIGTTPRTQKLSVSGSESTGDGFGAAIGILNTATGGANWYLRAGADGTRTPAGGFSIADGGAYKLVIDKAGNVAIGTNPMGPVNFRGAGGLIVAGANLDPQGGYDFSPLKNSDNLLVGWNRTGGQGEIDFISAKEHGSRGGFNFYDYTYDGARTPLLEISTTGSVLAKQNNPVLGSGDTNYISGEPTGYVRVRQNLYVDGNIIFYDHLEKKRWVQLWGRNDQYLGWQQAKQPSDLRLKGELQSIPSALDKIHKLRGVTYRWNAEALRYFTRDIETTISAGPQAMAEENQKLWQTEREKRYKEVAGTQIGVIAQDVEAVLPEAVTTDETGYKLVRYDELIPLVIEALKEEDKISQEQARTIASQQTEIRRLTVANQAAQQQLSELQEVKQELGHLEATVNKFLASGLSGDQDKATSAGERPAGGHPSASQ